MKALEYWPEAGDLVWCELGLRPPVAPMKVRFVIAFSASCERGLQFRERLLHLPDAELRRYVGPEVAPAEPQSL